jgi:hypothetical protein
MTNQQIIAAASVLIARQDWIVAMDNVTIADADVAVQIGYGIHLAIVGGVEHVAVGQSGCPAAWFTIAQIQAV